MNDLAETGRRLAESMAELERLVASAKTAVRERLASFLDEGEPAIFKAEAAKILGYSVPTLEREMRKKNPPPHYKDTGRVTFYTSELRAYKAIYRVGTVPKSSQL
jgi:hypothetical protein